jgi:hypothetical protein
MGRPLTEDEVAEMLKKLGSPAKLASQYREQQGLIGPVVLPIYWKVLKAGLGLALLVQAIASITTAAAGRPFFESLAPIFNYPSIALTVFAWVTIAFALLHFGGAKLQISEKWDPRKLPAVVKVERKKGRTEAIAALVVTAIGTVWWLYGLRHPFWVFGPGVLFMTFAPVWMRLYPLFVLMGIAEVLRYAVEIARPNATRLHTMGALGMRALSLIVFFFLIRAKEVFVAADPSNPQFRQALTSINYAVHLGLIIAAALAVYKLLLDIWKLMTKRPEQAQSAALSS